MRAVYLQGVKNGKIRTPRTEVFSGIVVEPQEKGAVAARA
jgi:hypothetical protein